METAEAETGIHKMAIRSDGVPNGSASKVNYRTEGVCAGEAKEEGKEHTQITETCFPAQVGLTAALF